MKNPPFVSIIIPALESEKTIVDTLQSLEEQDYPKDKMELILIVSGNDSTVEICKQIKNNLPSLKIHQMQGRIPAGKARNIGVSVSKGDICSFIDSDCIAPDNWLQKIIKNFENFSDIVGVLGVYSGGTSLVERMLGGELTSLEKKVGVYTSFIEGNCAFRRIIFEKGCRFGEITYGEASILGNCIKKQGFETLLDPSLHVFHQGHFSLWKHAKMGRKYYSWYLKNNTKNVLKSSFKAVLKSSFVYFSLLLLFFLPLLWIFSFMPLLEYLLRTLLISPFILVNSIFTLYIKKDYMISTKSKIKLFPYLLFLRWVHQFGYLLGALEVFRFALKK